MDVGDVMGLAGQQMPAELERRPMSVRVMAMVYAAKLGPATMKRSKDTAQLAAVLRKAVALEISGPFA